MELDFDFAVLIVIFALMLVCVGAPEATPKKLQQIRAEAIELEARRSEAMSTGDAKKMLLRSE